MCRIVDHTSGHTSDSQSCTLLLAVIGVCDAQLDKLPALCVMQDCHEAMTIAL